MPDKSLVALQQNIALGSHSDRVKDENNSSRLLDINANIQTYKHICWMFHEGALPFFFFLIWLKEDAYKLHQNYWQNENLKNEKV